MTGDPGDTSGPTTASPRRKPAGPERVNTPGGRRALDQVVILKAAVDFIDQHGRERLTMRRLGATLGVEAMALYRYVPGRDELLDGVVEVVMDELYTMTIGRGRPATWQEFLQQLAHGVRAISMEHPKIFPLVASRPPAAPWLRPPLRSLRWVEGFLEGLEHYGFGGTESVRIYRSFSTFLLGHLLLESAVYAVEPRTLPAADLEFVESSDLALYPRLMALSPQLSLDNFDNEFEDSLEEMIQRVSVAD
ncbi:TetR/AcrR family transcriptional regulator [uncultured Friedmanniella sp.]|uniref:TetR/AcrR family transcriptional regulator n=1 Tax=uncultured Friedmanniella sp. TaxID=335381 RepID=UPI0035CA9640